MRMVGSQHALFRCLIFVLLLLPARAFAVLDVGWFEFDKAAVRVDTTEPVEFTVQITGSPTSVEIEVENGDIVALASVGDGSWTAELTAAQALYGYTPDHLNNNFFGFLVGYEGGVRSVLLNMVISVITADVPPVPVWDESATMRVSNHVVNILKSDLTYPPGAQYNDVSQLFYAEWPDNFDFLNFVCSLPSYHGNRNHAAIKNEIQGLGMSIFDNTAAYGSAGRLLGRTEYPIDGYFDMAETGSVHELGHQWINSCTYPELQAGIPHWPPGTPAQGIMGFNIPGTNVGGMFSYDLVPLPGGDYEMQSADAVIDFTDLDLYLMGMLDPADVGSHFVFSDPAQEVCNLCSGPVTWLTVADVIAAQGARVPDVTTAQKSFRIATIIITRDRLLDDEEMAFFDYFAARGEAEVPLEFTIGRAPLDITDPFHVATGGRGVLRMSVGPVLYVDAAATGLGTGYSWDDALTRLDTAIAMATADGFVREIWVAAGEYHPTDSGDRTVSFALQNGIALYGGFVGGEKARDARDWRVNATILSGDIGVALDASDNSYHVVTAAGADATAVLDGFIISHGNANGGGSDDTGGGIYLDGGDPSFANVVVADNEAAADGGGMAWTPASGQSLTGITFERNSAGDSGAGLYVAGTNVAEIVDVVFRENSATRHGGGLTWNLGGGVSLQGVAFERNSAGINGGALFATAVSTAELVNVRFHENTALSLGGAILDAGSTMTMENCLLWANSAAAGGGGMYTSDGGSLELINVTFAANEAPLGGAMYTDTGAAPVLANVVMAFDAAAVSADEIYNSGGVPVISSSLISGCGGSGPAWDSSLGTDGGRNLDDDPQFKDITTGNLDIWSFSPVIDAGDDAAVPATLIGDIDGDPRIYGPAVDMGAYEHQGPPTGVGDEEDLPARTALRDAYPNPFNPETVIRWDVSRAEWVDLKIYNLAGELVRTAHAGVAAPGSYRFVWNGQDDRGRRVASGVYCCRLTAGGFSETKRMTLIK